MITTNDNHKMIESKNIGTKNHKLTDTTHRSNEPVQYLPA